MPRPDTPSDPIRYRVTFRISRPQSRRGEVSYDVCTLMGAAKAVVLATRKHDHAGAGHVLEARVTPLSEAPGGGCAPSDLMDREEW